MLLTDLILNQSCVQKIDIIFYLIVKTYQFLQLFLAEVQEQIQQEKLNYLSDYQFVNHLFWREFVMCNQKTAN